MSDKLVDIILERNDKLKAEKNPWNILYQSLSEYILTRKASFTEENEDEFLNIEYVWDSTATKANRVMASALKGMMFPSAKDSFNLVKSDNISDKEEILRYYEWATKELANIMGDSSSGLEVALDEYFLDNGCFGTSGIAIFEGKDVGLPEIPIIYKPWNIKRMSIAENENGMIDVIYYEFKMTIRNAVNKYGLDNLSSKAKGLYKKDKFSEKIKILHAIEPMKNLEKLTSNNNFKNFPYLSYHIEVETKHIIKDSGFKEVPVVVGRFSKVIDDVYGYSPGIEALSNIYMINLNFENFVRFSEKSADPPSAIVDGIFGDVIDMSPGAFNVMDLSSEIRGNVPPIMPMHSGRLQESERVREELRRDIADMFYIDRLLNFNNEAQMTLGEVRIRREIQNQTFPSLFVRQETEVLSPLIKRSFNIAFNAGRLGVVRGSDEEKKILALNQKLYIEGKITLLPEIKYIPDEVVEKMENNEEVYNIEYTTPAMRISRTEELNGIISTWEFAGNVAQVYPEILDNLNADKSIKITSELLGASTEILRSEEEVEKIRETRRLAIQQQAEMQQMAETANVAKSLGAQSD